MQSSVWAFNMHDWLKPPMNLPSAKCWKSSEALRRPGKFLIVHIFYSTTQKTQCKLHTPTPNKHRMLGWTAHTPAVWRAFVVFSHFISVYKIRKIQVELCYNARSFHIFFQFECIQSFLVPHSICIAITNTPCPYIHWTFLPMACAQRENNNNGK